MSRPKHKMRSVIDADPLGPECARVRDVLRRWTDPIGMRLHVEPFEGRVRALVGQQAGRFPARAEPEVIRLLAANLQRVLPDVEAFIEQWTRTCSGCGAQLPLIGFYPCRTTFDGRQAKCRRCDQSRSPSQECRMGEVEMPERQKPGKFCRMCCGLAHRVRGDRCSGCGLEFREES